MVILASWGYFTPPSGHTAPSFGHLSCGDPPSRPVSLSPEFFCLPAVSLSSLCPSAPALELQLLLHSRSLWFSPCWSGWLLTRPLICVYTCIMKWFLSENDLLWMAQLALGSSSSPSPSEPTLYL